MAQANAYRGVQLILHGRQLYYAISTLVEIENAVTKLSGADKEQLLRFTARALGAAHEKLPEPRDIPLEQIQRGIETDEQGMRDFLAGK